jgi:hypothetical protein
MGEGTQAPDRISIRDRESRIGRLRLVGGAAVVAVAFAAYGAFAPTAHADSADQVSPAAAATYPAGDAGTPALAATDATIAAHSAATEAASVSAGAVPAQYHQAQTPQYHASTAISTAPAFTGTNVRAVAAVLAPDPAPAIKVVRAHVPAADSAQARVAMRLSAAARAVAIENASPRTAALAPAAPASIHILTHAIAMQQSRGISVSRNPQLVVSAPGNRSGTTSSVATKQQQISRSTSSQIRPPRAPQKVVAASVARPSAKPTRQAPALRPARHRLAVPEPARAVVHQAAVTPVPVRPLKNTRALLLGMLFGLAYLGLLAVWFCSTRFRRSVRLAVWFCSTRFRFRRGVRRPLRV